MSNAEWTSGYVTDIDYTFGYYHELNPLRTKLTFLNSGIHCPKIKTACELGFGQGLSVNMHAAASPVAWWGTDFNPAQANFAQDLAEISGSNAVLYDESFESFLNRDDLPGFDYIGIHGIWSWISPENRNYLVEFIKKHLNVGGILYISYNTQPGWTAMIPLREMLTEYSRKMVTSGTPIATRIDEALNFASDILGVGASYFKANPFIKDRLDKLKDQNRNYLAHEYFNRDWLPMSFFQMSENLEGAKLDFGCSANPMDQIDPLNFTKEQLSLLNDIKDPLFKEAIKDLVINQQFRKDYWVKGKRLLSPLEQLEALKNLKVVLIIPRSQIELKVKGHLGQGQLDEAIYQPILDLLGDYKPKSLGQLEKLTKDKNITIQSIVQAAMILSSQNVIAYAQDEGVTAKAKAHTAKLNFYICKKSRGSNSIGYLSSPVTGGGIALSRFQQLFLLAHDTGKKTPEEWAAFVLKIIEGQGHRIIKEGKKLETHEENLDELKEQAYVFAKEYLPVLKALHVSCHN